MSSKDSGDLLSSGHARSVSGCSNLFNLTNATINDSQSVTYDQANGSSPTLPYSPTFAKTQPAGATSADAKEKVRPAGGNDKPAGKELKNKKKAKGAASTQKK